MSNLTKAYVDKIDALNEALDNTIKLCNDTLTKIDGLEDKATEVAQKEVDKLCERVNQSVNTKLNLTRDKVVEALSDKYIENIAIISMLKPIAELIQGGIKVDLQGLADAVLSLCAPYYQPYIKATQEQVEVLAEVPVKLQDTMSKINELAGLKNKIPMPEGVNLNKLDIKIKPISISDITGGAGA